MRAYLFHSTALFVLILLAYGFRLNPSRFYNRAIAVVPACFLLIASWATLSSQAEWVVISHRGAEYGLRAGLPRHNSAALVVSDTRPAKIGWAGASASFSDDPLALADRVLRVSDPSMNAGAVMRVDFAGDALRIRTDEGSRQIYVGGTLMTAPTVVQLDRGRTALRWGVNDIVLRVEPIGERFSRTVLLLSVLVLGAGLAVAGQPAALAWLPALCLAVYSVIIQARIGADLASLRGFRAAVVAIAFLCVLAIAHGLQRRFGPSRGRAGKHDKWLRSGGILLASMFALGTLLTTSGTAIIGRLETQKLVQWISVLLLATLIGLSATRWRKLGDLFSRHPIPMAASVIMVVPPVIAGLAKIGSPGRFLLVALMCWAWAALLGHVVFPDRPRGLSLQTLGVAGAWLYAAIIIMATDFGFGVAVALALLFTPLIMFPFRFRGIVLWTLVTGGVVFAGSFLGGWLPVNTVSRLVAWLNPSFGIVGSDQLERGRLAIQEGALWGEAWGPARQISIPDHDDDFVAATAGFELGWLGVLSLVGIFALAAIGLLAAGVRGDFERDQERARLRLAFAVAFVLFTVLLAGLNVAGVTGTVPLTGVPMIWVSRSADAALAFGIVLLVVASGTSRASCRPRISRRDQRSVAYAMLGLFLIPLLLGTIKLGETSLGWLKEPHSVWHSFHESPFQGTMATIERKVSTTGEAVFEVTSVGAGQVSLNGQALEGDGSTPLAGGDELTLDGKVFTFNDARWDPRLIREGWEFDPGREPVRIGRIPYSSRLWWFYGAPEINLEWDPFADLSTGEMQSTDRGWLFVPDQSPYLGARLIDADGNPGDPISAPLEVPELPGSLKLRLGTTTCSAFAMPDGRLKVDLLQSSRALAIAKAGRTHLGGGRLTSETGYRNTFRQDLRTQTAVRGLIEGGWARDLADGGIEFLRDEIPASDRALLREVDRLLYWRYGRVSAIPEVDVLRASDGRPVGFQKSVLLRRLHHGGTLTPRIEIFDRHDRPVDPDQLGLVQIAGSGAGGVHPGLRALAPAVAALSSVERKASLFYPLLHDRKPRALKLKLTVDADVQTVAIQALEEWSDRWHKTVTSRNIGEPAVQDLVAGVLIVDQSNRILAIASTPSVADTDEFREVLGHGRYDPRVEPLALNRVRTGSVMKVAVWPFFLARPAEFFFQSGANLFFKTWNPDGAGKLVPEKFVDRGSVSEFAGSKFKPVSNYHKQSWGLISLAKSIQESTNTHLVNLLAYIGEQGMDMIVATGEQMGMFREIGLLPAEMTDPNGPWERWLRWSWRNQTLEPIRPEPFGNVGGGPEMGKSLSTRVRFHLGDLSNVNGLNIVSTLNTLVNDGVFVAPSLIAGVEDHEFDPPVPEAIMAPEIARQLASYLGAVVRRDGTAGEAFNGSPLLEPQFGLLGKTGTSESRRVKVGPNGQRRTVPDRSGKVFVASYLPMPVQSSARLTVLVFAEAAGAGGPGQGAIDPLGAQKTARAVMEKLAGLGSEAGM